MNTQDLNALGTPLFADSRDMISLARDKRATAILLERLRDKHPEGDERYRDTEPRISSRRLA